jgi:Domain of unknown function (DUF2804), N-terminal/Domain of unknown function (DUF2804), C-terminal
MQTEKELTKPIYLCQEHGRLQPEAVGWSRTPLHICNLRGRWPRKKRWNYWAITSETHLFSVTVSNVDYVGLIFVYVADFANDQFNEMTQIVPLGRGCNLPDTVNADVVFAREGLRVEMLQTDGGVDLAVDIVDFEGLPLSAKFTINTPPDHETLNVVIPWDEKTFQFTSKQNTLPSAGSVTFGDETIQFGREQSFACLDYGRGIWPRNCVWNWGSASGMQNGRSLGLNLGGQWTDGTGMTENGICVNGNLTKISEELHWQYDKSNFMKPWHISAPSGSIDLTFTPFMERVAISNLWLVKSEVHQMFGYYNGTVKTTESESITVNNLIGWAEDHVAKW